MGANSKSWTDAIAALLADGEWHATEEVLTVGAAAVDTDRALQEMGSKQAQQPTERRIQVGRRNVAMQSITGMVRFGKAEFGDNRKQVRKSGEGKSAAIGPVAARVKELELVIEDLLLRLEALESYRDVAEAKAAGEDPGTQFLAAAGLSVDSASTN